MVAEWNVELNEGILPQDIMPNTHKSIGGLAQFVERILKWNHMYSCKILR